MGPSQSPCLVIAVDAEEEFNWSVFAPTSDSVTNLSHQIRMHRIFERYDAVPTYLIDYPVASKEPGYKPLLELHQQKLCEIEAQMHPWVNPPFEEVITPHNTFPGNLPMQLEHEKLRLLTQVIEERFLKRPTVYRAGRHGLGLNTIKILKNLGYKTDMSILPKTDLSSTGGPDFSKYGPSPFWLDADKIILEVPQTVEILGLLENFGEKLYAKVSGRLARSLRLPGILARLRLLDRITLTPEGITIAEAERLTNALVARGHKIFVLTYHSPSLCPGHTPYVRTQSDLQTFIAWIERYLQFFCGRIGGQLISLTELRNRYDTNHLLFEQRSQTN